MEKSYLTDEQIISDLMPRKFNRAGIAWIAILLIFCSVGMFAYYRQLKYGLIVTSMRDYASWGIYISNFVFFVAISLVGSLITAILRLSGVHWSTPLTRIAEIIAVAAITFASLIIIVDMGRPERFYNLFLYGRLQSPIIWDVTVISTYFIISLVLLYLPLLPDLRIMLSRTDNKLLHKLYKFMGGYWKGTFMQFRINNRAVNMLCITIVPVAFSIHTVTSWLFATTYRPGWDSTNFGAYFIAGAFLAGAGAVNVMMYFFHKFYKLENYITNEHFDKMGKITVMLGMLYLYFNINEFLTPYFKMKKPEVAFLDDLFTGNFAGLFWFAIFVGMIIPMFILLFKKGRKPLPVFVCGIMIVVGAWFKRYLIVTPTLLHPFLPMHNVPEMYKHYFPSWEEWAIAMGSLAGCLMVITIFVRIFPIIPIQETLTENHERSYANAEGNRPHFQQALADLRAARWMVEHKTGERPQTPTEREAIMQIDAAIRELKDAAMYDGMGGKAPKADERPDHEGRMRGSLDFLLKAHEEISLEEENPALRGLRGQSLQSIEAASNAIEKALRQEQ